MKMAEKKKLSRLNMNWTVLFIVSRPITLAAIAIRGVKNPPCQRVIDIPTSFFIPPDTFQPEIYFFFFLNRDIHFISLFKVDDLLKSPKINVRREKTTFGEPPS
jgi:hypothetical protein